jgi:hypothetical protein
LDFIVSCRQKVQEKWLAPQIYTPKATVEAALDFETVSRSPAWAGVLLLQL